MKSIVLAAVYGLFLLLALAPAIAVSSPPANGKNDVYTDVYSMEPGESIGCASHGGCIVMTKAAMRQFIKELEAEGVKACKAGGKGYSI